MQITANELQCLHCGLPTNPGSSFCCAGCESVYNLLMEKGLSHYYNLRDTYSFQKAKPIKEKTIDIDEPLGHKARFYLKGIHCLGCLWLLEKLPEIEPRILHSQLDFTHQILDVVINEKTFTWKETAQLIQRLGYDPEIINKDDESIRVADHHQQLMRIGVAGFCTGNIMLLAVSIYGGADQYWGLRFSWLSMALFLPVLFYSAWPLFRTAFLPLAKGRISVDLAISLAIWAGVLISFWSLFAGDGKYLYFDSLSMLVFLLLSSRYFLSRLRESMGKESPFLSFLYNEKYAITDPKPAILSADKISINDQFLLKMGQPLPVDSKLLRDAYFDLSLLSGESRPIKFLSGDTVESGAKLLSAETKLEAKRTAAESRLAKITQQIKLFQIHRSPTLDFAERVGKYFVLVVLTLAAGVFFFHPNEEGFRRALALIIVTCPCVLAFAIPLSFTRAMQIAARKGILFRIPEKLEALAEAKIIYLDKTGTLTNGNFEITRWENLEGSFNENKNIAHALEQGSSHPIAKAIVRYVNNDQISIQVSAWKEIVGKGVSGIINGAEWSICSLPGSQQAETRVGLFNASTLHAIITLGDSVREEAKIVVDEMRRIGLNPILLSGDQESSVCATAKSVGINEWKAELSPEQKAQIVKEKTHAIMVGDGANDGVAFQAASVGIAMQGAMDISLKNADILFTEPGLVNLLRSIKIAKRTRRIVRTNFSYTLAYNILAGTLAMGGIMSPLIAAILMPLSALTVFLFTQWQTREGNI